MSSNNYKYASDNIRLLLQFKGWTQKVLCAKSGITQITLRRRLKDNTGWTLLEATSIAKAFGKNVEEVFFTHMVPNGNKSEKCS